MQDLIDWLEDERTRDLVDMINRAAHGLPVDEAAQRYKERYRHNGSLNRLGEMFESLEERRDSSTRLTLNSAIRQVQACLASITDSRQRINEHCGGQRQLDSEDLALVQQLADLLAELGRQCSGLREEVIHAGSQGQPNPVGSMPQFTRRRA